MPENGHLNGSQEGGEKGYFWTLKMGFPGFPDFGLCRGRGGLQTKRRQKTPGLIKILRTTTQPRTIQPQANKSQGQESFGGVQTGFLANRARACVTRVIFVIFVIFRAGGANPLFSWTECTFVIFAIFVKTPCFRQGAKTPFDKNPVCVFPGGFATQGQE